MVKLVILGCCVALFIQGCVMSKKIGQAEQEVVSECYKLWKYEDLQTVQNIRVLLYNPRHNQDIYSYPNFLIGTNTAGDTVAIMDKDFEGKLKQGDMITVEPHNWTDAEKQIKKPLLTVRKKSSENKLYCSISIVLYGRIKD